MIAPISRAQPRYAELAVATNFSFLRGGSHPEELVATAISLGLAGIGIADRNSLAGVVRAHLFLRNNKENAGDFRLVTGARLVFRDGIPDVLIYPSDRDAYGRLTRLLTDGNRKRRKASAISRATIFSDISRVSSSSSWIRASWIIVRFSKNYPTPYPAVSGLRRRQAMAATCAPILPAAPNWHASIICRFSPPMTSS